VAKKRIYYPEFRRALENEAAKPVYLFTGAEDFLKEQGVKAIIDKALPPAERSMNLEFVYAGTDVTGQEVKERSLTLPFFTAGRVIVVRQAEKWRAGDLAAIADYSRDPSPSTVLVIVSQDERVKTEAWKALAAIAYHVECYPLFDNQVPAWVERQAAQYGKRISRDAVAILIERVGQSLAELDRELEKIAVYVGVEPAIAEKDVLAASGHTRQDSQHALNVAVGRRDAAAAVALAGHLLEEGTPPVQLLNGLVWHFRSLRSARQALDEGTDPEKLYAEIRNPQARQEWAAQIRSFQREEFDRIFQECLKLDDAIKSGRPHWDLWLQTTLLKICEPSPQEKFEDLPFANKRSFRVSRP